MISIYNFLKGRFWGPKVNKRKQRESPGMARRAGGSAKVNVMTKAGANQGPNRGRFGGFWGFGV